MISREGDMLKVSGRLTMDTVSKLFDYAFVSGADGKVHIDLAQVESVDSAAVSLLLCWLRRAHSAGVEVGYSNLPENLVSLARLYGVADLLPVAAAPAALS